jgi:mono/diheme cytochrome c family protein
MAFKVKKTFFNFALGILVVSFLTAGCRCGSDTSASGPSSNSPTAETPETPESKLLAKGKLVYFSNCISCHNRDPKLPGSLGPEIFGSTLELLTARILRAEYPAGYTPKRQSHAMPAQPHLSGDVDALTAYLNKK